MPSLQSLRASQNGAVRPPVAAEEEDDRQQDRDHDSLQDAEQHDAGGGDQGHAERAFAHLVVAAQQRQIHQRQRRGDHHRRERGLRQVGEQRVQEEKEDRDEPGADQAGQLGLRPRLLGDRGPRAARRDREPLEEAGRDVRRADADHLLIGLDLFSATGREAGRGRDRVGQRDQGDAERRQQQRRDVTGIRPGKSRGGHSLGQGPDRRDPVVGEAEDRRDDRGRDDSDEDRRQALGEERKHEQDGEDGEPEHERGGVRLAEAFHERLQLAEEGVGVGREPEQLRQLSDDDRDPEAVHVADLHLFGEQVGDEPELAEAEADLDQADEDREHARQGDRRPRVSDDQQGRDRGEDQRARSRSRARAPGPGKARRGRSRPGRRSSCRGR